MAFLPRPAKRKDSRPSAAKRSYNRRHQKWRLMVLARDPICKACNRLPSTDADHIIPLRDGGTWALENGAGLCKSCHSQKTWKESHGR